MMKCKIAVLCLLFMSVISYAEEPSFSMALMASGEWNSSDPIYQKLSGNANKTLPFVFSFKESVCDFLDMNPPKRGPSWLFGGKADPPYAWDFWIWGSGFDVKAIPQNQEARDLLSNPSNVAQVWWMKGRYKTWYKEGNNYYEVYNKSIHSIYPTAWNGWVLDGIYYSNQIMNQAKESPEVPHYYIMSYLPLPAKQTRLFENDFYVMDHPGINELLLYDTGSEFSVLHLNFMVQLIRNSPYTVLTQRDFHVKIKLDYSYSCASAFTGYAKMGINHISIPDWTNPPN